jgi:hypothetical protein
MKELMLFISGERGLVRRYLLLSVGLVALTFVAAQSLVALLTLVVPDQTQRISANTPPTGTRLYTVTRSVLDDNLTTGSISKPGTARIDPCKN